MKRGPFAQSEPESYVSFLSSAVTTVKNIFKDPPRRWLVVVVVCFVASRLFYTYFYGLKFEDNPLLDYMQYIDPLLLRTDLARSIFYLRDQPPLFNLFLGIVLKTCGNYSNAAFHATYFALGFALVTSMYLVLVRVRVAPAFAALVAILFTVAPTTVLYENWLFYTYPVATLLSVSALFLHRYLTTKRRRDAVVFFSLLATIALVRGIFHFVWLIALLVGLLIFAWPDRRRTLVAAAGPTLLVAAFYLKTLIVFGGLVSGQTYQQLNFAGMTISHLPQKDRQALIKQKKVTPVTTAAIGDFTSFKQFAPYIPEHVPTGIPMLDQEKKSSGYTNWQHGSTAAIGALYARDALVVNKLYPKLYWESVRSNFDVYAMVSSYTFPFGSSGSSNEKKIRTLVRAHDLHVGGETEVHQPVKRLVFGFLASIVFALALSIRWLWRRRPAADAPRVLTVAFLLFNIFYVSAVTILFSWGDHNRYRFKVSPLYCILLGMLVYAVWCRRGLLLWPYRRLRRGAAAPAPVPAVPSETIAPIEPLLAIPLIETISAVEPVAPIKAAPALETLEPSARDQASEADGPAP